MTYHETVQTAVEMIFHVRTHTDKQRLLSTRTKPGLTMKRKLTVQIYFHYTRRISIYS